jgi:O-methyltransferase involved in polyketide biosynthesis
MYLTKEATAATLRRVAVLPKGTCLVMSFIVPFDIADPKIRPGFEQAAKGARASGTPWISFFKPSEILEMAREAGFGAVRHVSSGELGRLYFTGRGDGLSLPETAEELLVAKV